MSDTVEFAALQRLRTMIEEQLHWGEIIHWKSYDFEKLSEKIQAKTGVVLSVSTLKRVFGKVSYGSSPSVTTLNTLAQFVDCADWRTFSGTYREETPSEPAVAETVERVTIETVPRRSFPKIAILILALLIAGFTVAKFFPVKRTAETYSFSSKTILTEGLPNSVIFDYDASSADEEDTVFIAQSWDVSRKFPVDRNDKHHSSIYYYPGYFRAKLIVGNEVVREHDIQIRTNGWLGLIEADRGKEPLYFTQKEIVGQGTIAVDDTLLKKYNVNTSPEPPRVRLYNQQDIHGILTDHFTFETELKTDDGRPGYSCQRVEVLLQARNDILIVPLVNPACVGDLYLAAYGFYTNSKRDDLSGFGCKLSDWVKLKIVCAEGKMHFMVQDKEVYTATVPIPHQATEIVGVQYRFNGPGAVRNTRLTGKPGKEVVF